MADLCGGSPQNGGEVESVKKTDKKNLRRISVVVTAQTLWHLHQMAAMAGYGEKDIGRVIDKLVRTKRTEGASE